MLDDKRAFVADLAASHGERLRRFLRTLQVFDDLLLTLGQRFVRHIASSHWRQQDARGIRSPDESRLHPRSFS